MEDGLLGGAGAHALKHVEMESSTAGDNATIPRPNMAAGTATEKMLEHEHAML